MRAMLGTDARIVACVTAVHGTGTIRTYRADTCVLAVPMARPGTPSPPIVPPPRSHARCASVYHTTYATGRLEYRRVAADQRHVTPRNARNDAHIAPVARFVAFANVADATWRSIVANARRAARRTLRSLAGARRRALRPVEGVLGVLCRYWNSGVVECSRSLVGTLPPSGLGGGIAHSVSTSQQLDQGGGDAERSWLRLTELRC